MYKVFDHLIAALQLLTADEFIGFVRLIDTARTANQAVDANAIEQSGLGAEADIVADFIDRIDLAGVGDHRRGGVGM